MAKKVTKKAATSAEPGSQTVNIEVVGKSVHCILAGGRRAVVEVDSVQGVADADGSQVDLLLAGGDRLAVQGTMGEAIAALGWDE